MLRKILIGLLLGVSVLWFLLGAVIHTLYYNNLPRVPDKNTGHIYRVVVNHGAVRYGTDRDARTLRLMQNGLPIAGLLFASALLLGLKLGVLHVRGEAPRVKNSTNRTEKEDSGGGAP
jgi:hypothetical protein